MSYTRIETTAPQRTSPGHPRFGSFPQPNSGNRSSMSSTSTIQRRSAIPTFRRQNTNTSVIEPSPIRPREPNSNRANLRQELTTFRDMNGAGVSGGLFVNTSSPVNVQYIGAEFVPSVRPLDDQVVGATGSSSNVHPTNASDNGSNITITPEPSQTAPYDIYYRHLLGEGRGVPLWEPGPDMSLPAVYRQEGISIGDVGIVYRAGYFDFLFNIFLPADHEINLGRVPSGFVPLDRSKVERAIRKSVVYDERGGCLASSSVQRTVSSEFAFQTTGRDGAVLVMPDGALAEDLKKNNLLNQYIAENAKRWYDYVESDECGVQAENGDIRVVVGMDKVSSWGMVAFKSTDAEERPRRFEFKDDARRGSDNRRYKWDGIVAGRAGPAEEELRNLVRTDDNTSPLRNQSVFVRTLNISVSGKVHNELAVHEIRAGHLKDCIPDSSWQQTRSGQQNISIQTPQVGLPVSNPSKPLHSYLLEKCPNAQVVITTDLDWMSVITENDATIPSFEEICSRVLASNTICEEKGVVTLKKRKNDVTGFISDAISTFPKTTSENPLLGHNARDGYVVRRLFLEAQNETAPSGTLSDISVGKHWSDKSSRIDECESLLYSRPSCCDPSGDDGGGANISSAKQRIINSEDGPVLDSATWKPGEGVQDLTEYRGDRDSPEDNSHQSLSPPYSDCSNANKISSGPGNCILEVAEMTPIKVGINGFGRIGRTFLRNFLELESKDIEVVCINDASMSPKLMSHLFQQDSVFGKYQGKVGIHKDKLVIDDKTIQLQHEQDPKRIKWEGVDFVIESTGAFTTLEQAGGHLESAKKVIVTAPSKDIPMYVRGVNLDKYKPDQEIISSASEMTYCAALICNLLQQKFKIDVVSIDVVQGATSRQRTVDGSPSSQERTSGRSVQNNIIPAKTAATYALEKVIPELEGRVIGHDTRVPVTNVSYVSLNLTFDESISREDLVKFIKEASQKPEYKDLLAYNEEELVSGDFCGRRESAIVDFAQLGVCHKTVQLPAWFDNEWSYSRRVCDLLCYVAKHDRDETRVR